MYKRQVPIPYASVSTLVSGHPLSATTDDDGRFVLKPLSPGLYGVTFFSMGMKKTLIPGVEVTTDRATYTVSYTHLTLPTSDLV